MLGVLLELFRLFVWELVRESAVKLVEKLAKVRAAMPKRRRKE